MQKMHNQLLREIFRGFTLENLGFGIMNLIVTIFSLRVSIVDVQGGFCSLGFKKFVL